MDRIYKFDNVKVWLMLLVIIGHTLIDSYDDWKSIEFLRFFCRCYTMPLFTFISGYLSSDRTSISKNFKFLLWPCILFTLVNDLLQSYINPNYVFSWKQPGFAMWYLWMLFIYRISLPYLLKIRYLLIISFLISWLVGFMPFIGMDFSLSRMFCFLPYFIFGYSIANDSYCVKLKEMLLTESKWRDGLLLILIFILWFLVINIYPGLTLGTGFAGGFGLSLKGLLVRIVLQLTILITGFLILKIFPNRQCFYTKYGNRTMNVYLLHSLIILPFAYLVFPSFGDATLFGKVAMVVIPTICCIPLFSSVVDRIMKMILLK